MINGFVPWIMSKKHRSVLKSKYSEKEFAESPTGVKPMTNPCRAHVEPKSPIHLSLFTFIISIFRALLYGRTPVTHQYKSLVYDLLPRVFHCSVVRAGVLSIPS